MSPMSKCCSASTSAATSACAGVMVCSLGDDLRQRAAMRQIAEWLEKLGMAEYAQRFAENGITVAALRHLTDQDLKDIGVLLGHRRIMLAAIAKIDDAEAVSAVSAATPPVAVPSAP